MMRATDSTSTPCTTSLLSQYRNPGDLLLQKLADHRADLRGSHNHRRQSPARDRHQSVRYVRRDQARDAAGHVHGRARRPAVDEARNDLSRDGSNVTQVSLGGPPASLTAYCWQMVHRGAALRTSPSVLPGPWSWDPRSRDGLKDRLKVTDRHALPAAGSEGSSGVPRASGSSGSCPR